MPKGSLAAQIPQRERLLESAGAMREVALTFLSALSEDQREAILYPVHGSERLNWDYRPRARAGLRLKDLDSSQQKLAYALLATGLSRSANAKALGIMSLEKLLREREDSQLYDPEFYWVTVFGTPSDRHPWGWRIEGHHLSVNILVANGGRVATTPNFFGANPAEVRHGRLEGFRVLAAEEDLARELLLSLGHGRRTKAIFAEDPPADIVTRWEPRVKPDAPVGLPVAEMTEQQQALAMRLLAVYTGRMPRDVASEYLDRIEKEGTGTVHFAWAGSAKPGEPHYYRLHGPSFLIEYDNTQNHANHIHTVWRDPRNDWGEDLLKAHYTEGHHREPCTR